MIQDTKITGNFEITILESRRLIYSRQQLLQDFDGNCENVDCSVGICGEEDERENVVVHILDILRKKKEMLEKA